MTVNDLLMDFTIASALILFGQLMRSKITFFQRFFIPASMIAGFIGLFLGPHFLNILPWSEVAGSYTGILIVGIFAVVGLNGFKIGGKGEHSGKATLERVISVSMYRFVIYFIQFALGITLGLTVVKWVSPGINDAFGMMMASGFTGGHGTAAAVGKTLGDLGWADATDLGMTFATLGILTGVFGGLAFIKWATKRGVTGYIKDFQYISGDLKTGLVAKENLAPMANETISSVSLDTLCYHLSWILVLTGGGLALNKYVLAPYLVKGVPDFTVAYLLALIFFLVFRKTGIYSHMDGRVNTRIAGTATDYLVFFGIAMIKVPVVIEYWLPILIEFACGLFCCFVTVIPLGYLMMKKSWFEHSMFMYGYSSGVFAIGFVLLRIVDPDNKSLTLEDVAMTPWLSFMEIFVWSLIPAALVAGHGWTVVAITALAGCVLPIIIAILCKCWYREPIDQRGFYGVDEKVKAE